MSVQIEPLPREAPKPPVYVANAGLVLAYPFLPFLFDRLGLLTAGTDGRSRVSDPEAQSRAVHLLQYIVTGRLDTPAPELALNKLLTGIPLSAPVAPKIAATPADLELCDGLLAAMIANWPQIGSTSPDGLRQAFLQREGKLQLADDHTRLDVQRKSIDVLMDQLPWHFTIVFHSWMSDPIHVGW